MRSIADKEKYKPLYFFIILWLLINLIQASFTGLDGDEAYYWMFSRKPDWGYFDHPPMVALSIGFGELFGHGSLFTRMGTILFSAFAVYFGYKALPDHLKYAGTYCLVFSSIVLLNMYGFIVTPDASLFFFTALFFYAYRLFLKKESSVHILLLVISITGLLYSKYHGVLPVFFTFLSNPKLILKPKAWLVIILVAVAFAPHLWWQYQHDWQTVRYHLLERIGSNYRIDKTTNYIAGQLLVWGPFTTIPALYLFIKNSVQDQYLRAHYFTLWGVFIFFLFSSFRSTIEPHWTLTAGVSFIVLFQNLLVNSSPKRQKIFTMLFVINIVLIIIARSLFVIPGSPLNKVKGFNSIFYGKEIADSLHSHSDGKPLVFINSYTQPSLYKYYHQDGQATSYNTVPHRRNYFNLSKDEALLNNKNVLIASGYDLGKPIVSIKKFSDHIHFYQLDSFTSVNSLKLTWIQPVENAKAGQTINLVVKIENAGEQTIYTGNRLFINCSFIKTRKEFYTSDEKYLITESELKPGFEKLISIKISPPSKTGKYKLIYSIVQPPFAGNFASPFYSIKVE